MTNSPFEIAENALLIFSEIPTEGTEMNEFGNIVTLKKEIKIRAYLKLANIYSKNRIGYENREGADTTDLALEGYLIDPMDYPPEIHTGMIANAEIKLYKGLLSKGTFVLRMIPTNAIILNIDVEGITKISGNFRILENCKIDI